MSLKCFFAWILALILQKLISMKKRNLLFVCVFIVTFIVTSIFSSYQQISQLENGLVVGYDDIVTANSEKKFGEFFTAELDENDCSVGGEKVKENTVVFKLFGIIPIKKIVVELLDDEEYYVGGVPIGLSINADGAIVVSNENHDKTCFKDGDIITQINGVNIESLDHIRDMLQNASNEIEITYIRKNRQFKTIVNISENLDGKVELGLWVKDDVSGVGTLTFINKNTHKYGALGHPIVEANGGNVVPVCDGEVFECNLIGINKGKKNDPGELRCVFLSNSKCKGNIVSNTKFGISGNMGDITGLVDENVTAKLGGRLGVKVGDAKIVSSISGIREEYNIEIIKANYQKSEGDKSIVFRVVDERLLDLTGGIVQGMSGSPIMQDGKIIGAVTHVFLTDPTKGYGVYIDWMI